MTTHRLQVDSCRVAKSLATARREHQKTPAPVRRVGVAANEPQHVSLSDLDLPLLDEEEHPSRGMYQQEHTKTWSRLVDGADGFIAVTPEYNYGMPAALKNALDYLSSQWAWKPMGFVSYGNTSAGTRSVQHAKQIITTLRLFPLGSTIALRLADTMRDGAVEENAKRDALAIGMLEELVRVAHALTPLRETAQRTSSPGPIKGSYIRPLSADDAPQVLVLQRCCWVEEALINATLDLAPLTETLDDVRDWLGDWAATGLWLDGRLIGMVRSREDARTSHIGRLAVVPDLRGRGVGRWLLRHPTQQLDAASDRIELHTGARSSSNIALYESEGFQQESESDGVVTLAKVR